MALIAMGRQGGGISTQETKPEELQTNTQMNQANPETPAAGVNADVSQPSTAEQPQASQPERNTTPEASSNALPSRPAEDTSVPPPQL